jgi:hypothetical protein
MKTLTLLTAALALALNTPSHADFFPKSNFIRGWKAGETRVYDDGKELSAYTEGGSARYTDFQFDGLAVQEYENAKIGGHLTVEIYKFVTPEDAFGVFLQDTSRSVVALGQGGRTDEYAAHFWKDDLYVRAYVAETNQSTIGVALMAAKDVDKKIQDKGKLPEWLVKLRGVGISLYFVRNGKALKRLAKVALPDSVAIPEKNGAAWVYNSSADTSNCLVMACQDSGAAGTLFDVLWKSIKVTSQGVVLSNRMGFARCQDGKVQALEKLDRFVFWVPAGRDEESCSKGLDKIRNILSQEEK